MFLIYNFSIANLKMGGDFLTFYSKSQYSILKLNRLLQVSSLETIFYKTGYVSHTINLYKLTFGRQFLRSLVNQRLKLY